LGAFIRIRRVIAVMTGAAISWLPIHSELSAGVLSAAAIVFCCLLWIRKRLSAKSRWAIGSVPNWRRAHYWAGMLVLPLAFWHSSMRWGGPVERILIALLGIVVSSGVAGYVLQSWEKLSGNQTHPSKQAAAESLKRFATIWPLIHVPLCLALLLLLGVHVVKAIYY
jgi:hypothetical protein